MGHKYWATAEHAADPLSTPATSLRYNGHFYSSSLVPPALVPRFLPFFPSNLWPVFWRAPTRQRPIFTFLHHVLLSTLFLALSKLVGQWHVRGEINCWCSKLAITQIANTLLYYFFFLTFFKDSICYHLCIRYHKNIRHATQKFSTLIRNVF